MKRYTLLFAILFLAGVSKPLFGGAVAPKKDDFLKKMWGEKHKEILRVSDRWLAEANVPALRSPDSSVTASGSLSYLAKSIADDNDVREAYKSYMLEYLKKETQFCKEYGAYLERYIQNEKGELEERRFAISMSNKMEIVIFVVVHILLIIAMWITITELRNAQQTRKIQRETEEIELSFQKIALKTSMHGTVLLVLSLFLYFLFLKFVYPVTVV